MEIEKDKLLIGNKSNNICSVILKQISPITMEEIRLNSFELFFNYFR